MQRVTEATSSHPRPSPSPPPSTLALPHPLPFLQQVLETYLSTTGFNKVLLPVKLLCCAVSRGGALLRVPSGLRGAQSPPPRALVPRPPWTNPPEDRSLPPTEPGWSCWVEGSPRQRGPWALGCEPLPEPGPHTGSRRPLSPVPGDLSQAGTPVSEALEGVGVGTQDHGCAGGHPGEAGGVQAATGWGQAPSPPGSPRSLTPVWLSPKPAALEAGFSPGARRDGCPTPTVPYLRGLEGWGSPWPSVAAPCELGRLVPREGGSWRRAGGSTLWVWEGPEAHGASGAVEASSWGGGPTSCLEPHSLAR